MGKNIEDERAISEDQSKGSWELNRSIDERSSLALIMTVSNVIIIIIITIIIAIITTIIMINNHQDIAFYLWHSA